MSEYPCGACNQYPCVCDVSEEYDNLGPNYLCYLCDHYNGENECVKYKGMAFHMFRRQKECKHYKIYEGLPCIPYEDFGEWYYDEM